MIQASELRIGNWILHLTQVGKMPIRVGYPQIKALFNNEQSFYEPILLTDELLEKCGFVEKHNHNSDGDERNWYQHPKLADIIYKDEVFAREFGITKMPHIQSLHQLQNLFFALTGEELNITL